MGVIKHHELCRMLLKFIVVVYPAVNRFTMIIAILKLIYYYLNIIVQGIYLIPIFDITLLIIEDQNFRCQYQPSLSKQLDYEHGQRLAISVF